MTLNCTKVNMLGAGSLHDLKVSPQGLGWLQGDRKHSRYTQELLGNTLLRHQNELHPRETDGHTCEGHGIPCIVH